MIAIIDYELGSLFSIYNELKEVYDYPTLITGDNISSIHV
jgi:imidazoleglycerol phosphate synthase glutamine amidotransferase subunit HisH